MTSRRRRRHTERPQGRSRAAASRLGLTVQEYEARRATLKHCPACNGWLPFDAFGADRSQHDGLAGRCKACRRRPRRADEEDG